MKALYKKNNYRTGLKLEGLSYDDRSQAVILNKGVPILSKVNNEDIGIFNNQRFKIVKYDAFTITIVLYIHRRACPLVNHTLFMSGIEWTSACDMWPCPVQGRMNILML